MTMTKLTPIPEVLKGLVFSRRGTNLKAALIDNTDALVLIVHLLSGRSPTGAVSLSDILSVHDKWRGISPGPRGLHIGRSYFSYSHASPIKESKFCLFWRVSRGLYALTDRGFKKAQLLLEMCGNRNIDDVPTASPPIISNAKTRIEVPDRPVPPVTLEIMYDGTHLDLYDPLVRKMLHEAWTRATHARRPNRPCTSRIDHCMSDGV